MALSTHSKPSNISPSVWISETLLEFQDLDRLVELNGALSGKASGRVHAFELIPAEIWSSIREKRNHAIRKIQEIPQDLSKEEYIETAGNVNEFICTYLERHLTDDITTRNQFYKDLQTISAYPPMDKTLKGNCGPTFMVSYPRFEKRGNILTDKGVSCVLKYTDPFEVIGHRFMEAVATGFTMERNKYKDEFFCVPQMSVFDLESHQISQMNERYELDHRTSLEFRKIFGSIIENYHFDPRMPPIRKTTIVRLEKMRAQNFPEFLITHYSSLSKEVRMSLFRRLGRIAYLDLVMGNNDRLITFNPKELVFEDEEANLGNLMVSVTEGGISLFTIDNGLNIYLSQPDQQAKYLSFLKDILKTHNFEEILAFQIKIAIIEALKDTENLSAFLQDLNTEGLKQMKDGIKKMETIMASQVAPAWDSHRLKLDLSLIDKNATDALNDRIQVASEAATRNRNNSSQLDTPLRRREGMDLLDSNQLDKSYYLKLIWNIYNHCSGSLEDQSFFKNTIIPSEHEDESLKKVFHLFHEIRASSFEGEQLRQLADLCSKVAEENGISFAKELQAPTQSAPTPTQAENPENHSSNLDSKTPE